MNAYLPRDMGALAVITNELLATDEPVAGRCPGACTARGGHRFVPSVFRANFEVCERCRRATRVVATEMRHRDREEKINA